MRLVIVTMHQTCACATVLPVVVIGNKSFEMYSLLTVFNLIAVAVDCVVSGTLTPVFVCYFVTCVLNLAVEEL